MYERSSTATLAAASPLSFASTLSVVADDPSVLGNQKFTFTFTTPSQASLVVIQVPSTPYYSLTTETIALGLNCYLYAEPVQQIAYYPNGATTSFTIVIPAFKIKLPNYVTTQKF